MIIIIVVVKETERKHSVKREAIFRALKETQSHPGARWVHERLKPEIPDLSLGTVYRNLTLFREDGRAISLGTVNGEERFDAVTGPHPHFICSRCGRVDDLSGDYGSTLIRCCEGAAKRNPGPAIDFRRTMFYGLCKDCGTPEGAGGIFPESGAV